MTRINVVPVEWLSDQWLLAEYRELPRIIKQKISVLSAPKKYCLGKGHMKWAKYHSRWVMRRYLEITWELQNRGFKTNFPFYKLFEVWEGKNNRDNDRWYDIKEEDIELNKSRLIEKYKLKPEFYRWTNRVKPNFLIQ